MGNIAHERRGDVPSDIELPGSLPLFVLPSILLLPGGRLPLNIFEPRYRALIDDALGQGRLVGIVQQKDPEATGDDPALYDIGCAGRIMSFSETDKGNYLISLRGVGRFKLSHELPFDKPYRRAAISWEAYGADLDAPAHGGVDRNRLFGALRQYFKTHGISANWDVIQETEDDSLVASLAMTCPFSPWEHQALLEAPDLAARARLLLTLLEMAALDTGDREMVKH